MRKNADARGSQFGLRAGLELPGSVELEEGKKKPTVVLLNLDGAEAARKSKLFAAIKATGARIVTFDLRATGSARLRPRPRGPCSRSQLRGMGLVGRAPTAWPVGRGRHGYVTLRAWADSSGNRGELIVIGEGPAGLVALGVAAREWIVVRRVAAVNTLASFVTDEPYTDQRLGPSLRASSATLGDVGHLAALIDGIGWQSSCASPVAYRPAASR